METPWFCAYTEEGHQNYGNSEKMKDIDLFYEESLFILKEVLSLSESIPVVVSKPNIIDNPIRTKQEIISEFDISEEEFNSKYSSYEHVLILHSQNVGLWNDEIEYYSKQINALSEAEILKAKYDLHQAIMNRVIVALTSQKQEYSKPWWKFWD